MTNPMSSLPAPAWQPIDTHEWPELFADVPEAIYCTNRGRVLAGIAHNNGWIYGNTVLSVKPHYCSSFPARANATGNERAPLSKNIERVILWMPLPAAPLVPKSEKEHEDSFTRVDTPDGPRALVPQPPNGDK